MTSNNSGFTLRKILIKGGGGVAINVASTLAAAGVISIASVLFISLSKLSFSNTTAFRLLAVTAILSALMATLGLVTQVLYHSRHSNSSERIAESLALLVNRIPAIDWSFNAAEHDRVTYQRIRKAIEDPRTMEFKVLTIFRDTKYEDISKAQHAALREYYQTLENVLATRRGFGYDRLIILRSAVKNKRSTRDLLLDLASARPEFIDHFRQAEKVPTHAMGARARFHFIADTGRMSDLAFAIALDQHGKPVTLLLEISIIRPKDGVTPEQSVLGLLALDNPSSQLVDWSPPRWLRVSRAGWSPPRCSR